MKLLSLLTSAGYQPGQLQNSPPVEITGVASDTRDLKPGNLFVCIRGLHSDSHTRVGEILQCGCAAIVAETGVEIEVPDGFPVFRTEDTRDALARLSSAFYGFPERELKMIGITGTNGKTSIAYLLRAILTSAGRTCGMIGTVSCYAGTRILRKETGNELAAMTTPDPPLLYRMLREMRNAGCDTAILEATSHASALHKLTPITFDLLIFTNLTEDHLDFHKTMEAYFEAKADLFRHTRMALIHIDGEDRKKSRYAHRIAEIAKQAGAAVYTCSAEERPADFRISAPLDLGIDGSRYLLKHDGKKSFPILCPLPGSYSRMNSAESAAAALLLNVPEETVQEAIRTFPAVPGRLERVTLPAECRFSVFIDFAHTPDALENLLRTIRKIRKTGERILLLFGCGGDRDPFKRKIMGAIAARYADMIYLTSDNSRSEDPEKILSEIAEGIPENTPCRVIVSREKAIRQAVADALPGDILLLAGKGHETYQIDRNGKHAFSEREIVIAAAEARFAQTPGTESDGREEK